MKLKDIKGQFERKEISKHEFISRMYENHLTLKDYADFLPLSGISKIEIEDGQLIFTSRATEYHSGGLRFSTNLEDSRVTPLEAFNFGRYENEDSEMIFKLVEKSFTIFDIGANIGWYTNHLAKILTKGQIYVFEPIPQTFDSLSVNVRLNGFKNIILNNIALSESEGQLTFYYSPKMTGASSARNITENKNASEITCKTDTLDNYCKQNNIRKLDFIKCDVEGAELFAFKGGLASIIEMKPIVFTEMLRKWSEKFNYHPNDIIALFDVIGYICFVNSKGKLSKITTIDENTIDTNFFFLHGMKHADLIQSLT